LALIVGLNRIPFEFKLKPLFYGKPDCQASKSVAKHLAAINAEAVSTDRLF